MDWDLPDTNGGVYNSYRLYMKFNNGPIQEVFNSDIDQTNESGFPIPRVGNKYQLSNSALSELVVSNITRESPKTPTTTASLSLKEADQLGNREGKQLI